MGPDSRLGTVDVLLVLIAQRRAPSNGSNLVAPIGVAYLAAALEHAGFRAEIEVYNPAASTPESLVERIRDLRPAVLGLSATTTEVLDLCELAAISKRASPGLLVVAGGYCSLDAKRLLSSPAIDIVAHGEGEQTIIEIVRRWIRREPGPIPWTDISGISYSGPFGHTKTASRPPTEDIDTLPIPCYAHDPPNSPAIRVYSSRGCPYECTFCRIKDYYGTSRIRTHSEDYMRRSIARLLDRATQSVRFIYFNDDEFLLLPTHFVRMARVVREFKLRMCFQTRTQDVVRHRDLLEQNGDVIFQVHMGVESFAQSQLDRWRKQTTVAINRQAIDTLSSLDISYYPYLILTDQQTSVGELEQNCHAILDLPDSPYEVSRDGCVTKVRVPPVLYGLEFNRMKDQHGNVVRAPETGWIEAVWAFIDRTFYEAKRLSELYLYSCLSRRGQQPRYSAAATLLNRRIALLPQIAREEQNARSHAASSLTRTLAGDFLRESEQARLSYMLDNLAMEVPNAVV
jgi:hypothetical protein